MNYMEAKMHALVSIVEEPNPAYTTLEGECKCFDVKHEASKIYWFWQRKSLGDLQ